MRNNQASNNNNNNRIIRIVVILLLAVVHVWVHLLPRVAFAVVVADADWEGRTRRRVRRCKPDFVSFLLKKLSLINMDRNIYILHACPLPLRDFGGSRKAGELQLMKDASVNPTQENANYKRNDSIL